MIARLAHPFELAVDARRTIKHPDGLFVDEHQPHLDWLGAFLTATNWWVMQDKDNGIRSGLAAVDVWD